MKALTVIAWISCGIGLLFILMGVISVFTGDNLFGFGTYIVNFCHAANSFFLLTIALFIYIYRCECKK